MRSSKQIRLVCFNGGSNGLATGYTNSLAVATLREDALGLFDTNHFNIELDSNQVVPGKLRIIPKGKFRETWDAWEDTHYRELIRIQRTLELALIQTFSPRSTSFKPSEDKQLINFAGKNRPLVNEKGDGNTGIYFDVIPRYDTKAKPFIVEGCNFEFTDETYGKPFNFAKKVEVSSENCRIIANRIKATLEKSNLAENVLLDQFPVKLSEKFNADTDCVGCIPSNEEPTGLACIQDPIGKRDFRILLDARDQKEPGRGFFSTGVHYSHLRYWPDETMVQVSKIFKAYRETINQLHGTTHFDFMSLMNLARAEGTHTHFHFIPRNLFLQNNKDIGIVGQHGITEFSMDATTYKAIPKASQRETASFYSHIFVKQLAQLGIEVTWSPQVNEQKIALRMCIT